jgi:hypothetical protein
MRIKTISSIFNKCLIQYPDAILVNESAVVNIDIDLSLDIYEFNLRIIKGMCNIKGGSEQSCLWGYYEYLERFYGYIWKSPTITVKNKTIVTPLRDLNVTYKLPYVMCEWKKVLNKDVREWLNIHRCISRRNRDTFIEVSLQKDWALDPNNINLIARDTNGSLQKVNEDGDFVKFQYDNPIFINKVIEQLSNIDLDILNLFPPDGTNFDSFSIPAKNTLYVKRGWYSLTEYFLQYYTKIANAIPNKRFDILAYSSYKQFPDKTNFDGSRFNCFFVPTNDYINYIRWMESGCDMYYRPNYWNKQIDTKEDFIAEADGFRKMKSIGFKGYVMDGFENDFNKYGLRYYLHARQTYKNKSIEDLIKEYES